MDGGFVVGMIVMVVLPWSKGSDSFLSCFCPTKFEFEFELN